MKLKKTNQNRYDDVCHFTKLLYFPFLISIVFSQCKPIFTLVMQANLHKIGEELVQQAKTGCYQKYESVIVITTSCFSFITRNQKSRKKVFSQFDNAQEKEAT